MMIDRCPFSSPKSEESPNINHVLYWVWEREAIRIAKDNKYEGKLTSDPILAKYRFCNIRRRDDRLSQWLLNNYYPQFQSSEDVWFAAAIARYVNWPPTLAKLTEEGAVPQNISSFDYYHFAEVVDGITQSGHKAWGGAYMIYPGHSEPGTPKGYRVGKCILAPLIDRAEEIREAVHSEKSVCLVIKSVVGSYGWSPFMAGQLAADLTYLPVLKDAEDLYTHAPAGPGSQRGLNRLLGKPLPYQWECEEFNRELIKLRNRIIYELDIDDLTLHDVQNCMCEVDKYWRTMYNEGSPKSIYKSETAY
jgi:hypothetical protein